MISDKYKLILIHIPKCAGSSIESMFDMKREISDKIYEYEYEIDKHHSVHKKFFVNRQHALASEAVDFYGHARWIEYTKFALVRNTYDRFVSLYKHHMASKLSPQMSFEDFANKFPLNQTGCKEIHFRFSAPQHVWINRPPINLGRVESFNESIQQLCNELGMNFVIPPRRDNKARDRTPYKEFYTNKTRDAIYQYYMIDFKNFNYGKKL